MRFGLDYAWTTVSPAAHRAVGSTFAARYLSTDRSKNLSLGEREQLQSGGIDVVVVWETTATRALDGEAAGRQDASVALQQANALGIPPGRPIYFAVDFDEAPNQAAAVERYFHGVASVLGTTRTGVYGGYWVVKRLFDAGVIRYGWQTYAWSGGNLDSRAQLYQFSNGHRVAGQDCDYNHSLKPDFGQWGFVVAAPQQPQPQPQPQPKPPKREEIVSIAATTNVDGRVEVFVEAQDGSVWHTYQEFAPGTKDITGWSGGVPNVTAAKLSPLAPAPK